MPIRPFNKSDLWFTADGDFLIDGAGDLRDTLDSGDLNEGIRQTIFHRLVGDKHAYRFHPDITAGLERFIGTTIDKHMLESMQVAIHKALVSDGVLSRGDYKIRVFELTPGDVIIMVFLNIPNQEHPIITAVWNTKYGEVTRVN